MHRRRDTEKINHTGMQEKNEKSRKHGTKERKQENRTQGDSIATDLPVLATKPRRGPCHTICHVLPALVGNGIMCRCRPPPPANRSTKTREVFGNNVFDGLGRDGN